MNKKLDNFLFKNTCNIHNSMVQKKYKDSNKLKSMSDIKLESLVL